MHGLSSIFVSERREKFSKDWVKCHLTDGPDLTARVTDVAEGKQYEFRYPLVSRILNPDHKRLFFF